MFRKAGYTSRYGTIRVANIGLVLNRGVVLWVSVVMLPFFKMLIFILKLVQQHLIVKTLGNKVRSFDIKYYIK